MVSTEIETSATPLEHDRAKTIAALTGVRAFAAVWVVLYHFKADLYAITPSAHRVDWVLENGYLGVDLFFALSGFILSYNYLHRLGQGWSAHKHGDFLWRRLARIYPVQLFTLNVFLALVVVAKAAGFSLHLKGVSTDTWAYVQNVFMVQAWWGQQDSFNGPAWSVSAEWLAYLAFPILALMLIRFRSVATATLGATAAYGMLIAAWVALYWNRDPFGAWPVLRIATEFTGGCLLFVIWERSRGLSKSRAWQWIAPITIAAVIIGCGAVSATHQRAVVLAPLFGLLILAIAKADRGPISMLLSLRAIVWGGEVSYCLYMTHGVVQPVINHLISPARIASHGIAERVLLGVMIAVVIVVAAVATYYVVEVPARKRMRQLAA